MEPKDTIHVEIETPRSRASNSRPGMVITTIRKTGVNQTGERILAVDHILGSW